MDGRQRVENASGPPEPTSPCPHAKSRPKDAAHLAVGGAGRGRGDGYSAGVNSDAHEIPLFCPRCRRETGMSLEASYTSQTVTCPACGAPIHWESCPRCETGYQAEFPGQPCPECRR